MADQIRAWVDQNRDLIFQTLRQFVSLDTQNLAPNGNEKLAQLELARLLETLGCEIDLYEISSVPGLLEHPKYWAARPCTDRPNLMAIRRGQTGGRSLLFSSHMDTVPVGSEPWEHPPWGGEISSGKLWGLGAYDMKGGLVASVMVTKALNDLGIQLNGDLLIESVVDEEFGGCNGTLAARLKYNADLAIVPEPTNLRICPAHHGGLMLRVNFAGKSGWGFSPEGAIDPVIAVAQFVQLLQDWAQSRQQTSSVPKVYSSNPKLSVVVNQLKAGDLNLPFFADRVPPNAWLTVWIETFPGTTQDEVMQDLRAYYRKTQQTNPTLAAFEPTWTPLRWLDGSGIDPQHPGVEMLARVSLETRGQRATIQGAEFACDGHMFNLYSPTPMILLGPTGGQPHSADEFIDTENYLQLVEIFIRAAIDWCGQEDLSDSQMATG
jgi:acetylornithine deacetylase